MPNMKKEKRVGSISTFLGADSRIEGTIEFQGTIRMDGRVKGRILSNGGTLIVGEKAVIHADIRVNSIVVMGEINGTIDAKERVEVFPPGRVNGDIEARVISIEPGGVYRQLPHENENGSGRKTGGSSQNLFRFKAPQTPIKFSKNPLTTGWCGWYRPPEPNHPFTHS